VTDTASQESQGIVPQPVPTAWAVNSLQGPTGEPLVMIHCQHPMGVSVFFLSRDDALGLASILKQAANSGPKLVTPPSGLVVPGR
jgi:hypothetical protein